jgi:hypothetical protein
METMAARRPIVTALAVVTAVLLLIVGGLAAYSGDSASSRESRRLLHADQGVNRGISCEAAASVVDVTLCVCQPHADDKV